MPYRALKIMKDLLEINAWAEQTPFDIEWWVMQQAVSSIFFWQSMLEALQKGQAAVADRNQGQGLDI